MTEQKRTRGRPLSFDRDQALERAMQAFWQHGYEGASLSELIEAMGINKPSMYRAFGNKEDLFILALHKYLNGPIKFIQEAITRQTAKEVIEHLLSSAAEVLTCEQFPKGCMVMQAALSTSEDANKIKEVLAEHRKKYEQLLADRFELAIKDGELPADVEPRVLAKYVCTIHQGMSIQASTGTSYTQLIDLVEVVMQSYPFSSFASEHK